MRVYTYDITFSEVPDETSLCLAISGCPNRCKGCSSPWLREDVGHILSDSYIEELLRKYPTVTCVTFLGGDAAPSRIIDLAKFVHELGYKTCWYSGCTDLPDTDALDYVKIGPWIAERGPLSSKTTNQEFYRRVEGVWVWCTDRFWK